MDGHRFDVLTKAFAARNSRRRFIAGAIAALSGLALPVHGRAVNCRRPGSRCTKSDECCSNECAIERGSSVGVCAGCGSDADCPQSTNPCQRSVCIKGVCTVKTIADGTPCTNSYCNVDQYCFAGECVSGEE